MCACVQVAETMKCSHDASNHASCRTITVQNAIVRLVVFPTNEEKTPTKTVADHTRIHVVRRAASNRSISMERTCAIARLDCAGGGQACTASPAAEHAPQQLKARWTLCADCCSSRGSSDALLPLHKGQMDAGTVIENVSFWRRAKRLAVEPRRVRAGLG